MFSNLWSQKVNDLSFFISQATSLNEVRKSHFFRTVCKLGSILFYQSTKLVHLCRSSEATRQSLDQCPTFADRFDISRSAKNNTQQLKFCNKRLFRSFQHNSLVQMILLVISWPVTPSLPSSVWRVCALCAQLLGYCVSTPAFQPRRCLLAYVKLQLSTEGQHWTCFNFLVFG